MSNPHILRNIRALFYYAYYNLRYGIKVGFNIAHIETFNDIFVYRTYEINEKLNPKLIIDGGANVGYSSIYFSIKYPDSKIYSIEPDKDNYKTLKENTKKFKNIIPINAGLWNNEGYLKIINPNEHSMGFVVKECDKETEDKVRAITIESLIGDYAKIDILKLDIEGSESDLFYSDYIEWLDKVGVMFIEVHDIIKDNSSENLFSAIKDYNNSDKSKGSRIIYKMQRGEKMVFGKLNDEVKG